MCTYILDGAAYLPSQNWGGDGRKIRNSKLASVAIVSLRPACLSPLSLKHVSSANTS